MPERDPSRVLRKQMHTKARSPLPGSCCYWRPCSHQPQGAGDAWDASLSLTPLLTGVSRRNGFIPTGTMISHCPTCVRCTFLSTDVPSHHLCISKWWNGGIGFPSTANC